MNPRIRSSVQRWLGSLGTRGEARSAAAVAALVGGRDPQVALARATATLRALPFSALTPDDLLSNADTGLEKKSAHARMGGISCFVSHSWSDDGVAKWHSLSEWAKDYKKQRNKDPTMWIDKGCLAQSSLADCLSTLPCYLAACERLLILLGPTYLSRVWCCLELFTWLQMGGSEQRITILPLGEFETAAAAAIEAFDASRAKCFVEDERQQLLAIIETAFGSFAPFNALCKQVLTRRLLPEAQRARGSFMVRPRQRQIV